MKKSIIVALACLAFFGCSDGKKQEKALLDSVITIHDKVMSKDGKLMDNKMKLDTLLKTKIAGTDTAQTMAMMMGLSVKLTNAEDAMEQWMQKFDPEQKGKSHEQIMSYLSDQKNQVTGIDSEMVEAINLSNNFLSQPKKP